MYEQDQAIPVVNKVKGSSLLLTIEIILLVLISYGLVTVNRPGAQSSIADMIGFISLIAIIPSIIISFFGIKDGITGIKNHTNNGVLVLIISLILLVVSALYAGLFLGVLSGLESFFRALQ
jgi:hypothetical protein